MNRCDIWYDWNAQMSGMWVQSADVARCGSGMSGMWPRIEPIYLLLSSWRCTISLELIAEEYHDTYHRCHNIHAVQM